MKLKWLAVAAAALVGLVVHSHAGWELVWNDEFNGSSVDPTRWAYDIGTGPPFPGWGNDELQYYTSRPENVLVTNGLLHITARKEAYSGADYTSARLKTKGRLNKTYGRFEFRARLPQGQGIWPAFWLMPVDSVYGTWAASGEVDVMELRGHQPTTVFGTIHFGGAWPDNTQSYGPAFNFSDGDSATNFHVYALEWSSNSISWYVDGSQYQTQTDWWSSGGPFPAPFNQPFYILMNLAVGGHFPGNPDDSTVFPATIQADYVRVYDYTPAPAPPGPQFTDIRVVEDMLVVTGSNGPPGATFHLLSTSDLAQPLSGWARTATNHFDSAGGFSQILTRGSQAFYRLEVP